MTSDSEKQEPEGFDQPWHARLFAITVALSESGKFPWTDWTELLGQELAKQASREGAASNACYYRSWLDALESLLEKRGLADSSEINVLVELWRDAHIETSHGQPVLVKSSRENYPE